MRLVASQSRTTIALFGAVVAAWAVIVGRMRGMDDGPGTDLGGLGWYLGIWATMTVAMMLPSATPAALLVARVSRGVPALVFALGYVAAWTAFGIVAYALFRLVTSFETDWLAWDRGGPYVAGGAIAAAGLYELTPVKELLLRCCRRAPEPHGHRPLRNGLTNGLACVGCCLGLMTALFALGVMSVLWMAVIGAVIFAEKALPNGRRVARIVGVALVVVGLWVAVSPSSVPGLTEPNQMPAMPMEM